MEILVIILIFASICAIGWIIEAIGNYIDKKKRETRELVYNELLGNCDTHKIFDQCKEDMKSIGYDRESIEAKESEFYKSLFKTPYQELLGKCPLCNEGYLRLNTGRYGKFIGCSKFPKCRYTTNIQSAKFKYKTSINEAIKEDFKKAYL